MEEREGGEAAGNAEGEPDVTVVREKMTDNRYSRRWYIMYQTDAYALGPIERAERVSAAEVIESFSDEVPASIWPDQRDVVEGEEYEFEIEYDNDEDDEEQAEGVCRRLSQAHDLPELRGAGIVQSDGYLHGGGRG